jgi:nitrogen-specific signal transduction histidine kinase
MRPEDLRRMNSVLRHRLRNHVSGMRTASDFLGTAMGDRMKPEEKEYFPLIRQECDDLLRLVDRLNLWFEDIPTGTPSGVATVLAAVVADVKARLPRATLILPDHPVADGWVVARPEHLRIVLSELVANGAEAAGLKPVQVNVAGDSGALRVTVEDRSTVPPKAPVADWFRPFFTSKPRHLGLGLAIAQRLLQDNAGAVTISPVAGTGTLVELVWPLAPVEPGG